MKERVLYVEKRGNWIEDEIVGVVCPFCRSWARINYHECPTCHARLSGVRYKTPWLSYAGKERILCRRYE